MIGSTMRKGWLSLTDRVAPIRRNTQIEKEKRGVDPEKFMAYVRSKVVGEGMYYLLLDEIQMLDCFEAVLNGYLRKDN